MKTYQTKFAQVFFGGKSDTLQNCQSLINKPIVFGHQVHKNDLIEVEVHNGGSDCLIAPSDGLFTSKKDITVGLYTADCIPCVLATRNTLFSLHLGWKGVYSGLLRKALSKINSEFEVFIGPHICFESFEVQIDLVNSFSKVYEKEESWHRTLENKHFISLLELIMIDIKHTGLEYKLYYDKADTFSSDDYFSYRADNKTKERNLTFSFLTA